jgi:electron transfer flavoprotein beta subunit
MGADEVSTIQVDPAELDGHAVAALLAAYVRSKGGADLVLCGRQASDDDQGVVAPLLGELLDVPVVTIARDVQLDSGAEPAVVRVTRVTPDGDEVVEASCPAIVTISNELGTPRYPTTMRTMKACRIVPNQVSIESLGLSADDIVPRVSLTKQYVSTVQGNCDFIEAPSPDEQAAALIAKLRAERVLE